VSSRDLIRKKKKTSSEIFICFSLLSSCCAIGHQGVVCVLMVGISFFFSFYIIIYFLSLSHWGWVINNEANSSIIREAAGFFLAHMAVAIGPPECIVYI
jgi:hypothetical protein